MRQRGGGASPGRGRTPGRSGDIRAGSARQGARSGARAGTGRPGVSRLSASKATPSSAPRAPRTSGVRPTAARRGAGAGGAAKRTRAPQPRRFTGRALILGVVMLGLLLAYAYPVRVYLGQQAEIAAWEQKQNEQREAILALEEQNAKWEDPAYITSQARKRLQMVLDGETPIVVIDPAANATPSSGGGQAGGKGDEPAWYGKLWSSLDSADKR